nr:MAG TPA: hypothetical protein [Bacteriophage sp.]
MRSHLSIKITPPFVLYSIRGKSGNEKAISIESR